MSRHASERIAHLAALTMTWPVQRRKWMNRVRRALHLQPAIAHLLADVQK
jgi:hypothetical protein